MPAEEEKFSFEGGAAFAADLQRLAALILVEDERALAEFARTLLVPAIKSLVPRLTGQLAGSVSVEEVPFEHAVDVIEEQPYAGWIEWGGTRGRRYVARGRFLLPTVRKAGPSVKAAISSHTTSTIGRFPWSHTS